MYRRICIAVALAGLLAGAMGLGLAVSASASTSGHTPINYRVTGTDQTGTTVVMYCAEADGTSSPYYCHSVYGGDPRTVAGGLSKAKQAARGFVWGYVDHVDATCQDDATFVGLEKLCTWVVV